MKKKILILDGHLYEEGLASQLARQYRQGAEQAGHEVRFVEVRNLRFDPVLRHGYKKRTELEADLLTQRENILWCDHLVLATPIWWSGFPALLKGFVDRLFLPGFAFSYEGSKVFPKKLLIGRSARVIYTQGSPRWITALFFDVHWLIMKVGIFGFVGFSPVKKFAVGDAERLSEEQKEALLLRAFEIGRNGK